MIDEAKKYLSDIVHAIELIEMFMGEIDDFDEYVDDLNRIYVENHSFISVYSSS